MQQIIITYVPPQLTCNSVTLSGKIAVHTCSDERSTSPAQPINLKNSPYFSLIRETNSCNGVSHLNPMIRNINKKNPCNDRNNFLFDAHKHKIDG